MKSIRNLLKKVLYKISNTKCGSHILYIIYYQLFLKKFKESSININHINNMIFVHNPKCAGTSIKSSLRMDCNQADHRIPTDLVNPKTWEKYYSFVIVRNPYDRLVSSYAYHTSERYIGEYLIKYPNIKKLCFNEYFELMIKEPYAIRPQVDYVTHKFSNKEADCILKFENLNEGIERLNKTGQIKINNLEHKNMSTHKNYREYFNGDKLFLKKVTDYYQRDLIKFGYEY